MLIYLTSFDNEESHKDTSNSMKIEMCKEIVDRGQT